MKDGFISLPVFLLPNLCCRAAAAAAAARVILIIIITQHQMNRQSL
jgi:hypothetical protein